MGIAPCISNILQKCNAVEDPGDGDPTGGTHTLPSDVAPNDPGVDEHFFVPAGAELPANLAALIALGDLTQNVAWNEQEFVTLGDGSHAYWDGGAWQAGEAPA